MNKSRQQKGFSLIEIILVLALVCLLVGIGWYVVKKRGEDKTPTTSNTVPTPTPNTPQVALKKYSNAKVDINFSYPETWALAESIANTNGNGDEGTILLTSPNGLKLHINPHSGGRGGNCEQDPTDKPHNTHNCNTLEVLSKEKIGMIGKAASDYSVADVYLFNVKFTVGRDSSTTSKQTTYNTFLSNSTPLIDAKAPLIGTWFSEGQVTLTKKVLYLDTYLSDVDLSKPEVLQSADVKTAQDVLRTVRQ